ncbi:Dihydropteroate synthase [hydrothermal vent metagenome]|uniref:dihydropteroate synthase n=1 Tax=hydrothermal vent metagenome TaxID=652676 RepID=A0A3B1BD17_9ZZZZ
MLECNGKLLDLSLLTPPKVMGILNITPDSFSDGGLFLSADKALQQAQQMVQDGAAIIDVGGESTRPGAAAVTAQEELDRVIPVIESIHRECGAIISIDSSKPEVMREAVKAGAGMINDVRALREPGAMEAANETGVPVCLMHMQGEPRTMQKKPEYTDVVQVVKSFLQKRIMSCEAAGIDAVLVDPGFGFGKTVDHNLQLVKNLREFTMLGKPVLMGVSRKSSIAALLSRSTNDERLAGSVAMATLCCQYGASIIRAHDVAATVDAVKIYHAVTHAGT